jgi:hypothetical protein
VRWLVDVVQSDGRLSLAVSIEGPMRNQFSLLTALVLVLVAGALLYANMHGQFPFHKIDDPNSLVLYAWNRWTFLLNVVANIGILAITGCVTELAARRRMRRNRSE